MSHESQSKGITLTHESSIPFVSFSALIKKAMDGTIWNVDLDAQSSVFVAMNNDLLSFQHQLGDNGITKTAIQQRVVDLENCHYLLFQQQARGMIDAWNAIQLVVHSAGSEFRTSSDFPEQLCQHLLSMSLPLDINASRRIVASFTGKPALLPVPSIKAPATIQSTLPIVDFNPVFDTFNSHPHLWDDDTKKAFTKEHHRYQQILSVLRPIEKALIANGVEPQPGSLVQQSVQLILLCGALKREWEGVSLREPLCSLYQSLVINPSHTEMLTGTIPQSVKECISNYPAQPFQSSMPDVWMPSAAETLRAMYYRVIGGNRNSVIDGFDTELRDFLKHSDDLVSYSRHLSKVANLVAGQDHRGGESVVHFIQRAGSILKSSQDSWLTTLEVGQECLAEPRALGASLTEYQEQELLSSSLQSKGVTANPQFIALVKDYAALKNKPNTDGEEALPTRRSSSILALPETLRYYKNNLSDLNTIGSDFSTSIQDQRGRFSLANFAESVDELALSRRMANVVKDSLFKLDLPTPSSGVLASIEVEIPWMFALERTSESAKSVELLFWAINNRTNSAWLDHALNSISLPVELTSKYTTDIKPSGLDVGIDNSGLAAAVPAKKIDHAEKTVTRRSP